MNKLQNPVFRSVLAILTGCLLVFWPHLALDYIILILGVAFVVPAAFSLVMYLAQNPGKNSGRGKSSGRMFPIESIGALLFGLCLILIPQVFSAFLIYLLGILLVVVLVFQLLNLLMIHQRRSVPFIFYIFPVLVLVTGLLILFNPFSATEKVLMLVFGSATIFYGLVDLINYIKFK